MITGAVTPFNEAVIPLHVAGRAGQEERVLAVIDTGFTDYLTLSPSIIAALSLPAAGSMHVELADHSERELEAFLAMVVWDGSPLEITALQVEGDSLVGMSLLTGYELRVRVIDGGAVEIERLS